MAIYREASVPPSFTSWSYQNTRWARLRNQVGYKLIDWISQPAWQIINDYRQQWKLPTVSRLDETFLPLAQLSQQPAAFDFPRTTLPACFHYVGPLRHPSPQPVPFPFEQLTGQPLVYASLNCDSATCSNSFLVLTFPVKPG